MRTLSVLTIAGAVAVIALFSSAPREGLGASIQVETTADEVAIDGQCSLRQAIQSANVDAAIDCVAGSGPNDIIHVPAGVYQLQFLGQFQISEGVEIIGDGGSGTIIDGQDQHRAFVVGSGVELEMRQITVRNGNAAGSCGGAISTTGGTVTLNNGVILEDNSADSGGAICNNGGTLNLFSVRIRGNEATTQDGGGIRNFNNGQVTMDYVEVRDNHADSFLGGGIANSFGTLTMDHSLVADNTVSNVGGGLLNGSGVSLGTATITNSTFSGNSDGAISNQSMGVLHLLNVTISDNPNGGIGNALNAQSTIQNSLIDDSCSGDGGTSLGNNLDSSDNGCDLARGGPDDIQASDPVIGPLQGNGGFTNTHAVLQGSPAIDAANDAACPDDDQRSIDRPQGGGCDIGAYESFLTAATPTPTPSVSPTPSPTASPTEDGTPTASPTVSPGPGSATPVPQEVTWGDNNCSGPPPDPVDSLLTLRFDAGLSTNTGECPEIGVVVEVGEASPHPWGDVDCGGDVNPVDSLKLLRFDAGLDVAQGEGCPELGTTVSIVV